MEHLKTPTPSPIPDVMLWGLGTKYAEFSVQTLLFYFFPGVPIVLLPPGCPHGVQHNLALYTVACKYQAGLRCKRRDTRSQPLHFN